MLLVVLLLQGYHSLQSYRVAHVLWNQGRKVLAMALQSRISEVRSNFKFSMAFTVLLQMQCTILLEFWFHSDTF